MSTLIFEPFPLADMIRKGRLEYGCLRDFGDFGDMEIKADYRLVDDEPVKAITLEKS
jgi:hypothetical protein